MVPADIMILNSSAPKGICYVETKNLDGETNLKHKLSKKEILEYFQDEAQIIEAMGEINCENPNAVLYNFEGSLDSFNFFRHRDY